MKSKEAVAELAKKAYDTGYKYEVEYRGCGQCLVGAVQEVLGLDDPTVFKAASGFAGGVGLMGDSACGGYAGGVMILSGFRGRTKDNITDPERIRFKSFELAGKLHEKFIKEFGTVNCHGIHMGVFGRPYYLWDEDQMGKFDEAGGHSDKCPHVVGLAAKWVVEVLAEEGLLE